VQNEIRNQQDAADFVLGWGCGFGQFGLVRFVRPRFFLAAPSFSLSLWDWDWGIVTGIDFFVVILRSVNYPNSAAVPNGLMRDSRRYRGAGS
jgi:hypothetical protein